MKEFIKLNVKMNVIIENAKRIELNTKIMTTFLNINFNNIQDGAFWEAHGWGEQRRSFYLKSVAYILQ